MRPPEEDGSCIKRTEWFSVDTEKNHHIETLSPKKIELVRPTEGLHIAYDPRIPFHYQKFRFEIKGATDVKSFSWILNGTEIEKSNEPSFLWPVKRGKQKLSVAMTDNKEIIYTLPPVTFVVK